MDETDRAIGAILEKWLSRDMDPGRCRFCNTFKEGLKTEPPKYKFCRLKCMRNFESVMKARLVIGERDLKQKGY